MRELSRTERYEAQQQQIQTLRQKAIDTKTLARAYSDLADAIANLPTRGAISDLAQKDLVKRATFRSEQCSAVALAQETEANDIESKGI